MSTKKDHILEIKKLVVDFPIFGGIMQRKVDSVHAVKKVSFDLIKGETLSIVGESGSGKSTVGNAILNVLKLTAPEVYVDGKIFLNTNDNKVDILNLKKKEMKPYRKYINTSIELNINYFRQQQIQREQNYRVNGIYRKYNRFDIDNPANSQWFREMSFRRKYLTNLKRHNIPIKAFDTNNYFLYWILAINWIRIYGNLDFI